MADFHPNQSNGQHKCENCGALYDVTWTRFPMRDSDKEDCHCCRTPMAKWNSTSCPSFILVEECPGDKDVGFISS